MLTSATCKPRTSRPSTSKAAEGLFEVVEVKPRPITGEGPATSTVTTDYEFTTNPFTILLYNQIQIYFHIWLKISVNTKILLVGNAPLSLVNLYAQVTKKRPIFY